MAARSLDGGQLALTPLGLSYYPVFVSAGTRRFILEGIFRADEATAPSTGRSVLLPCCSDGGGGGGGDDGFEDDDRN